MAKQPLIKFSEPCGDGFAPYIHAPSWKLEAVGPKQRLTCAFGASTIDVLHDLLDELEGSFALLYLLLVPRATEAEGRYQSANWYSREEVQRFLRRFRAYLEQDGRHHLWMYCSETRAQIVYDRHEIVYIYDGSAAVIAKACGVARHEERPRIPDPHSHHYHEEFDGQEVAILSEYEWVHFPLEEGDTV